MLKIYNTLSRKKEVFTPIVSGEIKIYVCGMTVYDYCHIGHARVMVFFDTVARHLAAAGYQVTYVRNITDIDDKIIARANDKGESFHDLTARFIEAMHEDNQALGVNPPSFEPRATQSMALIMDMINTLLKKNLAYTTDNGDVYFAVNKFADYGKLSGKNIDELQAGARVAASDIKQAAGDFALWKAAKPDEPSWDAPWGQGRPGWHIECSAMAEEYLGKHFDIHGGGMDLIFPHHENEIAQSESCSGHQHVNTWMHVGFVRVNDEKMSKSLDNFFTIREVLAEYPAEVIRFFLLSSHYRSPLNYSKENLDHAKTALSRLYKALGTTDVANEATTAVEKFNAAMDDDFNTPEAIAVLFELARLINRAQESNQDATAEKQTLLALGNRLGFLTSTAHDFFHVGVDDDALIDDLIKERNTARTNKDFATADKIRTQLDDMGIILEDNPNGTSWRRS